MGRCIGYWAWSFISLTRCHYILRGRRRSSVCLQPQRRAGFIDSFFLYIGFGGRGAQRNALHEVFLRCRAWEALVPPGFCIWASTSFFHSLSADRRWGSWVFGRHHSYPRLCCSSASGLRSEAPVTPGKPSSSSESLMYVNWADDAHSRPGPGAASRIQYTTVLLIPSIAFPISPSIMPFGLCRRRWWEAVTEEPIFSCILCVRSEQESRPPDEANVPAGPVYNCMVLSVSLRCLSLRVGMHCADSIIP